MIIPEGISGVAFGLAADGNPRIDETARAAIGAQLGIGDAWAWARQVHDRTVVRATAPGIGPEGDGLLTTDPEIAVAVSTADCFPVALVSDTAAGMAHAGWRGVAAGVVPATAEAMAEAGHSPRVAVIGPGIGPCCFEVGPEVLEVFPQDSSQTTWGTPSVDLVGAIRRSLSGIGEVVVIGACTHHDDRFFSFRRNGTRQRQFGVAWIARG